MAGTPESAVRYSVNRLTVETHSTPAEFQSRYEEAVPPLPAEHVAALVQQHAPWQEMVDLVAAAAPHGFLITSRMTLTQWCGWPVTGHQGWRT